MWAHVYRMKQKSRSWWAAILSLACLLAFSTPAHAHAINKLPDPPPAPGSYGLEATKLKPPPTQAATLSTPTNGASFTDSPITVSGLCTKDDNGDNLLVEIYDNGVLVGSIDCTTDSFSIQVSLFTGTNELNAIQYDSLGQHGPDSNHVSVTYNNASFSAFGTLVTLTSNYARRAANPGDTLTWPMLLSGGNGPYAFSTNWGDGSALDLKSVPLAGEVDINHVYKQSGIYHVTVKATDVNGVSAFIQLVAVANGTPSASTGSSSSGKAKTVTITKILWWPAVICAVLLLPAFWLGRRSELVSLHRKLEHDMKSFKDLP